MMTPQWTIWCDGDSEKYPSSKCCAMEMISGSKKQVKEEAVKSGWKVKSGKHYCPKCSKSL